MLVLDDPLSAVDTETERLLVENLRPAVAGPTVLIAAQRLSTVEVADRVVVLVDGRVVEVGDAGTLLEHDGPFAALFGDEMPLPLTSRSAIGLSRLGRYARERKIAPLRSWSSPPRLTAAASVGGWLIVRDAVDNGMRADDRSRLTPDVVVYLVDQRSAWVLGAVSSAAWPARPGHRARAARATSSATSRALSLRYFSRAARGLDHRASDERRRRRLGRPRRGPRRRSWPTA